MNTAVPTPRRPLCWTLLAAGLFLAAEPAPALETGEFDPTPLDALLRQYVKEDRVDYGAWKKEGLEALDAFLEKAAEHDLTATMGKEPRGAFLINLYNAWAVRQILEHYPVKSIDAIDGFFTTTRRIAREERSLESIESELDRVLSYTPDFCFALASGAAGMPSLPDRAFTSENLVETARASAARYLAREDCLRFDKETKILHLPPQFERHKDLFEGQEQGLVGYLSTHMELSDLVAIHSSQPETVYCKPDPGLNDAALAPKGAEMEKPKDAGDGGR